MTLVNRWYEILELLLAKERTAIRDMADMLSLSRPTLMKSVQTLQDAIYPDLDIEEKDGFLSLHVYDMARLDHILAGELWQKTDFNSSGRRAAYLLKRLIEAGKPLVTEDLAEELSVSRSTVRNDLRQVQKLLDEYGLTYVSRPNRGLEVFGDEVKKRLLYLHEVLRYFPLDSLSEELSETFHSLCAMYGIPAKIRKLLKKSLSVTVSRIKSGNPLEEPILHYRNEVSAASFPQELILATEMAEGVSLSIYDRDFLLFPLNLQAISGLKRSEGAQIRRLHNEAVEGLKERLWVDLDAEEMFLKFHVHLKYLITRLIFHAQEKDIFFGGIRRKYPFSYEIARVYLEELAKCLGTQAEAAEVSYLAVYFELLMQKEGRGIQKSRKRVAVVCTTGRGTALMIQNQLEQVLGSDVEILHFSEESFDPDDQEYFAVFTTVPLRLSDLSYPIIRITNLFDDRWLRHIWAKVKTQKRRRLKYVEKRFVRITDIGDYIGCIRKMALMLIAEGLTDAGFCDRLLEREKKQTTLFSEETAFPHAINMGSDRVVMMIGIWEHVGSTVYIFLAAIPEKTDEKIEEELVLLYNDIFRVANDAAMKNALRTLTDEEDFVRFSEEEGVF